MKIDEGVIDHNVVLIAKEATSWIYDCDFRDADNRNAFMCLAEINGAIELADLLKGEIDNE